MLSALLRLTGYAVPVLKLPFLAGAWLGWALLFSLLIVSMRWCRNLQTDWALSPLTLKQLRRFRSLQRGYWSFLILTALAVIAALDTALVGKRALLVSYQGQWFCPAFRADIIPGHSFGLKEESEPNYRQLQQQFSRAAQGDWVLMPLIPYDPMLDSDEVVETLELRADGLTYITGATQPFNGRAHTVFAQQPELKRQEFTYRKGLRHGELRGWDRKGEQIERGRYQQGQRVEYTDYSQGRAAELEKEASQELRTTVYPPAPPSWKHRHLLGTDAAGHDVLAVLFGGLQQAFLAAFLFVSFVFVSGILLGGVMGYFGGWVDLIGQRLVEIWSMLPFLFVVMIISSLIQPTLIILVSIIAIFGWMSTATLLRTATMREKARDYTAAARLLGASPARILFHHILPNTLAILVTLAPFEVAAIITSLAALDFLGFGLPPEVPSWGRLLHEGTESFNYPWIVSAAFLAMVGTLILVTFVGEAIREAFDPKKFTVYR
jgi:microcin C transport system permease protein